jgi:hypothetical protein
LTPADLAVAVAERDEILAQQPDAHRRAIGLGDLAHQQGRDPIAPPCPSLSPARSGSAARLISRMGPGTRACIETPGGLGVHSSDLRRNKTGV